jgi:hypothetical protein
MTDRVEIRVYVQLPWADKEKCYSYAIDRLEVSDSLAPMSRNREIGPFEHTEAIRHHERRKRLIELVANMISNSLMNACESEDTDHGYKDR